MNYRLKSSSLENRQRYSRNKAIMVFLALIIIIGLLVLTPARQWIVSIVSPLWSAENNLLDSATNALEFLKPKQTLITEKQAMQERIFMAGTLEALNSVLTKENEELKDLLGRKEIKKKTVLAAILVKPPKNFYDILTIDIGTNHGVKVGNVVVANANVYIGEIVEVYPDTAKVLMYSSPGNKRTVVIGADSVSAEAVGLGGSNFSITLPREVEVVEGDVVVIPSINPNVFGVVERVSVEDKDSFQTILFKSPVNISELNFVEVVL